MSELLNNCIGLTITSPPYNIGKDSDIDLTDEEYLTMMKKYLQRFIELLSLEVKISC